MDIEKVGPVLEAVKFYIEAKGITFNEIDACRFLQKTVNITLWGTPTGIYSKNAASVVELVDTGRTEIGGYTYWLFLGDRTHEKHSKLPPHLCSCNIEERLYGEPAKIINADFIPFDKVDKWFLDYIDRKFPYRSKATST